MEIEYTYEEVLEYNLFLAELLQFKGVMELTSKKWTVIISTGLTVFWLVIFSFFHFGIYRYFHILESYPNRELLSIWKGYVITISSGILTSAFVTLLVAGSDYFDGRRKALKNVFYTSEDLQRIFGKIKYIFPDEPIELVSDLFGEIDGNARSEEYNLYFMEQLKNVDDSDRAKKLYNECHMQITHDAENKFKEYIWEHTEKRIKKGYKKPHMKTDYLDRVCKKKIEQYSKQLDDAMKSYVAFNEVRIKELRAAFEDLDFIFANKSIKKEIENRLYLKQVDQINLIKYTNIHFNLYFEGKGGNRAVMLDYVWKLQGSLTSEDENAYYRQYMYDVDNEMIKVLLYADKETYKNESQDKRHYLITTKPGWYNRLLQNQGGEQLI